MVRVGIDIGGTFTDLVAFAGEERVAASKVLTTPGDYGAGIRDGLRSLCHAGGFPPAEIDTIYHGTTVATNAILSRSGARTALVTTKGFRDVLELGRLVRPNLYDLSWDKPEPIAPRDLRFEIAERIGPDGELLTPLDGSEVERLVERVAEAEVDAVAICLINSHANWVHEEQLGEALRASGRCGRVCLSSELLPEIREYERTSTTVINAFLIPVVQRYMDRLGRDLEDEGIEASVFIMQSNGGTMSPRAAAELPVHIIESGPAAGVLGGIELMRRLGLRDAITLDMGGTTAKACLVENARASETRSQEVGAGINLGIEMPGAGYTVAMPTFDIAEVGAGGGSIAWVDEGAALRVGPESAGADPGPACYGTGGDRPTVTDAVAALRYLNPDAIAEGKVAIHAEEAESAIARHVAEPIGVSVMEAAHDIIRVAVSNMIRAVKAVTTDRGKDPSEFDLVAFGGAGPLFAAMVAEELGIATVVVPQDAGVFSASGLLTAEPRRDRSRAVIAELSAVDVGELYAVWSEIEAEAVTELREELGESDIRVERLLDLAYRGQTYELPVPVPEPVEQADPARWAERFDELHERHYGYRRSGVPIRVMAARVRAEAVTSRTRNASRGGGAVMPPDEAQCTREREVYLRPSGWQPVGVLDHREVGSDHVVGTAIIEAPDATIVVPASWDASRGEGSALVLSRSGRPKAAVETAPGALGLGARLEVFKNALESITDRMAITVMRTAASTAVRDARDFSIALCRKDGTVIAQNTGLALHLGSVPGAMEALRRRFPEGLRVGDVAILNDPYEGGAHLPDIFMFQPVYAGGDELLAYSVVIAHHADIGGRVAGGNAPDSTEIYQEGLRLPPVLLFEEGRRSETLFRILAANVRLPETVVGDIESQAAGCRVGERELTRLIQTHGEGTVRSLVDELTSYSRRIVETELRALRQGTYSFTDYLDDDGAGAERLPVSVTVTVADGRVHVDFTGTAPQVRSAMNAPRSFTDGCVFFAIRAILRADVPNNGGWFGLIEITTPERSIVDASFPAAVTGRAAIGFRIVDALWGALSEAGEGRVPAAGEGGTNPITIGGHRSDGTPFILLDPIMGGLGGRPQKDGVDGIANPLGNLTNIPVEMIEALFPVRVEEYGFVPDTAGAGRFRGSLSVCRSLRLLDGTAELSTRGERMVVPPYGLFGGSAGSLGSYELTPDDGEGVRLPPKVTRRMSAGDTIRLVQAGGGGYGDPTERDVELVARDVKRGNVTVAAAEEMYGVVFHADALVVDLAATERIRSDRQQARESLQ